MEAENNRQTRLQKLSGSDFEIVDGQPDIRGWDVKDNSGKYLGEVDELIFDYQSRKVRYLVLDLDENEYDIEDKEVLVPIGVAELHEEDDDVILPSITVEQLRSLPEYNEDRFDSEYESNVRNVFGGLGGAAMAGAATDTDFYNHDHFNENNLYRNRNKTSSMADDSTTPLTGDMDLAGELDGERSGIRLRSRTALSDPLENDDTFMEDDIKAIEEEEDDDLIDSLEDDSDLDEKVIRKNNATTDSDFDLEGDDELRPRANRVDD